MSEDGSSKAEEGAMSMSPLLNRSAGGSTYPVPPQAPEHRDYGTASSDDQQRLLQSALLSQERDLSAMTQTSRPTRVLSPPSSRRSSRASSPARSESGEEDLPVNVCTEDQLLRLPPECLSEDVDRPLRHVDEMEEVSHHALQPMFYSVIFILLVELLERFSFYGINYTQTSYLTGAYNSEWNAGMDAIPASSYVAISVAVAYTTPFLGAVLADSLLGDYKSILVGIMAFYLPGLFLIAFTTIPGLLGKEFNRQALAVGLLFLWPVGTGIVKSIVNVFGAKQYHPLLQSSLIEAYYVKFYMCINIGALVGGVLVPLIAQQNVTTAYFLPVLMLTLGGLLFMLGSSRYVKSKPKGNLFATKKYPRLGKTDPIGLNVILRVSLLVVPFNIAYSQMATTFIVQGTVMKKAFGWIDAASMNNADAISVLMFGSLVGNVFYPFLANRGIKIPTTYKFAIGSALGALAIAWALFVEHKINSHFQETGKKISIVWQTWSYVLIGAGEIFAVSAAYEVAFSAAPPEKKVLASAVNLFCIGALPNYLCLILYHLCKPWFENSRGTTSITRIADYVTADVHNYFWLLLLISVFGVFLNLLPPVRSFVESVEEKAVDMMKSPKTPQRPPRMERDEEASLLQIRRHQAYLKYGSGPTLYKQGSMRAGPALSSRGSQSQRHLKRSMIPTLYRSDPVLPGVGTVISGKSGKPIQAGFLLKSGAKKREQFKLERSSSK